MKFERQTRKIMYVESEDIYRVSFDPVTAVKRTARDSKKHLVGIAAAIAYWDNVDRRSHCLACSRTIKAAWDNGDRYLLDTDEARRAAELVADLASTRPDDRDICSALSDLLNTIAEVRLADTTMEDFEVLQCCKEAFERCFAVEGFTSWTSQARRRRFLYELTRKDRTPVVYTLMGLYFNYGAVPLLTSRQKQELICLDRGNDAEGAVRFFDNCLRKITEYRFS